MQVIELQLPIVEVQIQGTEDIIHFPISDIKSVHTGMAAWRIAQNFALAFQKTIMDKGYYKDLLKYRLSENFEQKNISLSFKQEMFKKKLGFRAFSIQIPYLVQVQQRGYWCIVPTLGIETFTDSEHKIEEAVEEVILLDFARQHRFDFVQSLISVMWYEGLELHQHSTNINAYSLNELEKLGEQKKSLFLERATQELKVEQQVLFGYDNYLKQLNDALKNRYGRSVLLVGKSGVGKSTLIKEWVFKNRKKSDMPKVWATTASTLIKELTADMGWQENIVLLIKELMERGDMIYISNLLELFEVGQYEGNSVSMAEYLRDYIGKGELSLISECSDEEYALIEARSPNYLNFFQIIRLEEPQGNDLEQIVLQKMLSLSGNKTAKIDPEAVSETIRLNRRYTPYSGLPGKPIRFLESILLRYHKKEEKKKIIIDRSTVIQSFCEETGMPTFMVDPDIELDIAAMQHFFLQNVFGQDAAVNILVDVLLAVKTALMRPGKPIASMLFAGPTGVGKTEMAKVLAEFMFGSRERMIRFDMSEYSNPYAIARLTGEGAYNDGILTSAVRREPFCVLLFDELEKAHPLFNDLLLQMLGEGRLSDSRGKVVNFCSTIIIMTSNIGASKMQTRRVGWSDELSAQEVTEHFENELRGYFRPEIYNRIDQIIAFQPLSKAVMRRVVDREIKQLKQREGIARRKVDIHFSTPLLDYLCDLGYDARYGARALQRSMKEELIIPISFELNRYGQDDRLQVRVDKVGDNIEIEVKSDPLQFEFLMEELQLNEYLDYVGDLRHTVNLLCEGHLFVHLLSDLDKMKSEIKTLKNKFWDDAEKSNYYSNAMAIKDLVEEKQKEVEQLEMDLALAALDLCPLQTQLYEQIKAWDKSFFQVKLNLYRLLDSDADKIWIGIYLNRFQGNFHPLLQLYLHACREKDFQLSIQSVWYRESLYREIEDLVLDEEDFLQEEADDLKIVATISEGDEPKRFKVERIKKAYYKKEYLPEKDAKSLTPDKEGDRLLGIELAIKGPGVNLFFAHETQVHCIESLEDKNKEERFWLETGNGLSPETPKDIFRKDFNTLQKKPRRKYSARGIQDSELSFPRYEIFPHQRPQEMLHIWVRLFEKHLDELMR